MRPTSPRRRRSARGFALVEILVAGTVLTIGVLGHASSVLSSHKMSRAVADQGAATETLCRFIDRLRADPDWAGLYGKLRPLSVESASDAPLSSLAADPTLTTHPVTAYYSDFTTPASLGTVRFLVQVPSLAVDGVPALRESAVAPRYGLPHDLNADGLVDSASRGSDYLVLPVVVRLRWQRGGQNSQEIAVSTLLRGER
jgi:hypothetical protein